MNEVFGRIKAFVVEKNFIDAEKMAEETEIENGLGITGNDVVEFLLELGQKFEVDVSEFDFEDYFMTEGIRPSTILKALSSEDSKRKKLTQGDCIVPLRERKTPLRALR